MTGFVVWILTDETPHGPEVDSDYGVGISLLGAFSTKERALAYLEAQGHTGLEWEDDETELVLLGPDQEAFAISKVAVDQKWAWVAEHHPDLAAGR